MALLLKSRFIPEPMANGAMRIKPRNTETAVAEMIGMFFSFFTDYRIEGPNKNRQDHQ
ncbi:hypothetical protein RCO48_03165 [Peribacillus frigoritolerans]|nr:hypothetical protein [Peribacillus frigoritolerans]